MVETRSGVTSWPGGSSWLWKDVALAYGGEFLVTVEWNTLDTGALIASLIFDSMASSCSYTLFQHGFDTNTAVSVTSGGLLVIMSAILSLDK